MKLILALITAALASACAAPVHQAHSSTGDKCDARENIVGFGRGWSSYESNFPRSKCNE